MAKHLGFRQQELDSVEDLRPSAADEQELRLSTMLGAQQRIFEQVR
jgi:hypothetical protein